MIEDLTPYYNYTVTVSAINPGGPSVERNETMTTEQDSKIFYVP